MRASVESAKLARIGDLDDALTWSINLSSNLARLSDLVIVRSFNNFIPIGLTKMVLPSQLSSLTRILQEFWRNVGQVKWCQIWWRYVIGVEAQSGNLSQFLKQYKMHLLHNLKILPKSKIWSCAHIVDCMGLKVGGG